MSSAHQSLSKLPENLHNAESFRFGIVVAEWNDTITFALRDGAIEALKLAGALDQTLLSDKSPEVLNSPQEHPSYFRIRLMTLLFVSAV